jgi:hypothetical protein
MLLWWWLKSAIFGEVLVCGTTLYGGDVLGIRGPLHDHVIGPERA